MVFDVLFRRRSFTVSNAAFVRLCIGGGRSAAGWNLWPVCRSLSCACCRWLGRLTMDRPMAVASTEVAGGSSRSRTSSPASRTSATGDGDPDTSLDEPTRRKCRMRARRQALSEIDVVEDIIEGFSIASFKSLEDLEVWVFDLVIIVSYGGSYYRPNTQAHRHCCYWLTSPNPNPNPNFNQ